MTEIKINGETYYEIEVAAKKAGLTTNTLKQYIRAYRREELSRFTTKVGKTVLFSKPGISYVESLRKDRKMNQGYNNPIKLGGINFKSKVEACKYFGFTASELSHYLKVKNLAEKELERTQ